MTICVKLVPILSLEMSQRFEMHYICPDCGKYSKWCMGVYAETGDRPLPALNCPICGYVGPSKEVR